MFWHVSVHPSVCSHLGGYPARSRWGVPCQRVPCRGVPTPRPGPGGGYPAGGYLPPARSRGVPCQGYLPPPLARSRRGGGVTLPGGVPLLGHQKEYLIRCGRYAFCVHAGGLSCCSRWLLVNSIDYLMWGLVMGKAGGGRALNPFTPSSDPGCIRQYILLKYYIQLAVPQWKHQIICA